MIKKDLKNNKIRVDYYSLFIIFNSKVGGILVLVIQCVHFY